ncbi:hypothetical protein MIR68_003533 [Amoeboaphelidium protococcarum]|nr:hypothetical protein MIR68_003533 [Amoeboaphelidium protococcarum]
MAQQDFTQLSDSIFQNKWQKLFEQTQYDITNKLRPQIDRIESNLPKFGIFTGAADQIDSVQMRHSVNQLCLETVANIKDLSISVIDLTAMTDAQLDLGIDDMNNLDFESISMEIISDDDQVQLTDIKSDGHQKITFSQDQLAIIRNIDPQLIEMKKQELRLSKQFKEQCERFQHLRLKVIEQIRQHKLPLSEDERKEQRRQKMQQRQIVEKSSHHQDIKQVHIVQMQQDQAISHGIQADHNTQSAITLVNKEKAESIISVSHHSNDIQPLVKRLNRMMTNQRITLHKLESVRDITCSYEDSTKAWRRPWYTQRYQLTAFILGIIVLACIITALALAR